MSSFFDKAKDAAEKATEFVADHTEQVDGGIDKAGDLVDKATGGRFSEHLDTAQDKAHEAVDNLDKEPPGPTAPTNPGN